MLKQIEETELKEEIVKLIEQKEKSPRLPTHSS
jgi:hypothetical protein